MHIEYQDVEHTDEEINLGARKRRRSTKACLLQMYNMLQIQMDGSVLMGFPHYRYTQRNMDGIKKFCCANTIFWMNVK